MSGFHPGYPLRKQQGLTVHSKPRWSLGASSHGPAHCRAARRKRQAKAGAAAAAAAAAAATATGEAAEDVEAPRKHSAGGTYRAAAAANEEYEVSKLQKARRGPRDVPWWNRSEVLALEGMVWYH